MENIFVRRIFTENTVSLKTLIISAIGNKYARHLEMTRVSYNHKNFVILQCGLVENAVFRGFSRKREFTCTIVQKAQLVHNLSSNSLFMSSQNFALIEFCAHRILRSNFFYMHSFFTCRILTFYCRILKGQIILYALNTLLKSALYYQHISIYH